MGLKININFLIILRLLTEIISIVLKLMTEINLLHSLLKNITVWIIVRR